MSVIKKKILIRGPILTRSGYGEQTRFAYRSLKSRPDLFEVYLIPTGWGQTSWITDDTDEQPFQHIYIFAGSGWRGVGTFGRCEGSLGPGAGILEIC